MFLILVFQTLFELLLHIVLVHLDILDLVQMIPRLLVGKLQHIGLVEPPQHIFSDLCLGLYALKTLLKCHVELVKLCLALHQYHPRHIVKLCQRALAQSLVKRFLQVQPLAQ